MSKKLKLDAIDTSSLVDRVEDRILQYIKENKLVVGDALPKEIDLSEEMGVSRTVIREALLRLKTIGLIESKKHIGTVITNPNIFSPFKKIFHPSVLDEETLKDLFEMRLALEVGMADIIVDRVTDDDLKDLDAIASKVVSGDTSDPWNIRDEIKFHSKLYMISQNKVLLELQRMLLPIFQYVHNSGLLEREIVEGDFVSHKELVEVLKRRDADAFRTSMRKHLNNHFARITNSLFLDTAKI